MTVLPKVNDHPVLSWNVRGKELTYEITASDKITLYRACAYEGKPQYAVCWTLLQRFAFLYPKFKTLDSFLKKYVQPINPDWFIDGSKHLTYVNRLKDNFQGEQLTSKISDAERRANNRKIYSTSEINKPYISIVEDIFNSNITTPGNGIIHYCASFAPSNVSEDAAQRAAILFGTKRGMIAVDFGQSFLPGTNWFFKTIKSSNFKLRIL